MTIKQAVIEKLKSRKKKLIRAEFDVFIPTDLQIAEEVGCSRGYVGAVRKEMGLEGNPGAIDLTGMISKNFDEENK